MLGTSVRRVSILVLLALVVLGLWGCSVGPIVVGTRIETLARWFFYRPFQALAQNIVFAWSFWVALIITLGLEKLVPAEPTRRIFSVSLAHDVVWFLYEPFSNAIIVGTYIAVLTKVHSVYFPSVTFSGLAATPGWARLAVVLLVVDLCHWVQHYLNHAVPLFWRFHAIHHSQRQLNFFSDFRYHTLEYVVRHTILVIPLLFLKIDPPVIVAVAVVREWYSRFYHGNIRTNLGPLRYVLVTPQSHRIHHSLEMRHRDMNFGALLSIWDRLFGQQYRGSDEYPETGIDDPSFPHEQELTFKSLLLTPWRQMLHPLHNLRAYPAARSGEMA